MLEICKWKNGAASPVLLMIDDLANVWVDVNGNGQIDPGEDWGYAKNGPHSSFSFLNEQLLKLYPEVKTTFFTPVGKRAGLLENSPIFRVAEPINLDMETIEFFRSLQQHPQFEVAYHGTTHGKPGAESRLFVQEWDMYQNPTEAAVSIAEGIAIYQEVFGVAPRGGKYCGYVSNHFSDASINDAGFTWWCRYWNRGILDGPGCRIGGEDQNPQTAFDIKFFGNQNVIDIPSTLSGALFTELCGVNRNSFKNRIKKILSPYLMLKKYREIDFLLENELVIAIQEHIAPSRDDGRRQQPNIFDDLASLKRIFTYLQSKKVWFCTGSELAGYVQLRQQTQIEKVSDTRFVLTHSPHLAAEGQELSLRIADVSGREIFTPQGQKVGIQNDIANIPLQIGEYEIK